jgi:pentatricopeptide repeat protein
MLINGFCKACKANETIQILEKLQDNGCVPNIFTYRILVDGFYNSSKIEDITKVLDAILRRRICPGLDA